MGRTPLPLNANPTANLTDRISACKNPEFAQWMRELWQEAAQREGNKLQWVYKRAMESIILHPEPVLDVKDSVKIPYVGPGIVTKLEQRLRKFLAEGGKLVHAAANVNSQPITAVNRPLAEITSAVLEEAVLSQQSPGKRKQPAAKRARTYVPTYRSGPYAMLIALYLESQGPSSKGYCTRQEIVSLGQPYCSSPLEEGTFSALRGAIKKLEEKEWVTKIGVPSRYSLTDEGMEMAERLWDSGERRSSAPIHELQLPTASTRTNSPMPNVVLLDSDDDDDGENCTPTSNEDNIRLLTFKWPPGTFDLKLIIDSREVKSKTERDYLYQQLSAAGIPVEQRSLELGDFIWLAKKKQTFRNGAHDDLEEAVLDVIIERKTEDDLLHSIVDGRFMEQKFRLNSSGITNRVYLLEKYDGADFSSIGENKYRAAITHTQILDNLFLRYTANLEESIKFVVALHKDLINKYVTKSINLAVQPDSTDTRRAPFLAALHRQSQIDSCRYLMSYGCFSQINSKSGGQTLRDLFLRQLMTIRHMSAERAALISDQYPTPIALYEMFKRLPDDKRRREFFSSWVVPGSVRRFGPMLSERIFETFWIPTAPK